MAVDSAKVLALAGPCEYNQRTIKKAAGCNVASNIEVVQVREIEYEQALFLKSLIR
ncbi:hypothetical protein QUF81_15740 [Peribacillus simplex]|uniref:Uncharacterized protein n=1 Tax=Peribacillus simplex TaxID=1478 RepID=A0AAW7IEQ2_9BACI|nr:hypothetical protein [Peribacillus simplex]MDM5294619.1 hypothetical protein [Peribacillus simplex]MDM5453571.1 hypothetical protein [Peribacillus simplex]